MIAHYIEEIAVFHPKAVPATEARCCIELGNRVGFLERGNHETYWHGPAKMFGNSSGKQAWVTDLLVDPENSSGTNFAV